MTDFQPGAVLNTVAFGNRPEGVEVPHIDVRAPAATDFMFPIGKEWLDTVGEALYVLASHTSSPTGTSASWIFLGAADGDLNTLTTDDSTIVIPVSGNINLAGASPLSTTGSGSTATVNLSGTVSVAHGGTGVAAITAHDLIVGNGTSAVTLLAPSATSGVPLISQGASADPAYGTAVVAGGGTGATTLTIHGVVVGQTTSAVHVTAAGTDGQVLLGATSADPAFGTLTSTTGVAFTTGTNSLAVNIKSGGFAVSAVSGTSQAMAVQTTYIANNASLTTFTLPATASVGDVMNVVGSALNTGGWKITYTTGQIIWGPSGASTITTGNAATGAAAAQVCSLVCVVANTTWVIQSNSGTITLT